jgi:archaeosine synthase
MLGIGEPSTVSLLAYMGVDILDCSLPKAAGMMGVRLLPEAEIAADGDASEANILSMQEEIAKTRTFISCDRLRELVDQRSFSSPSSVAALRIYDDVGYAYAEESCSTVGRRFCCNSTQALRRPDLKRYRERMGSYRKPPCKRVLLLLPCSAKKPYHISKTHKAFSSAIHTAPHDTLVHEVIVTSPLGIVPRELDFMYPANAYDIPVTG